MELFGARLFAETLFRPKLLASMVESIGKGRSGYWRLFFTKLQEEALTKERQNAEAKPEKTDAVAQVVAARVPEKKARTSKKSAEVRAPATARPAISLKTPAREHSPTIGELLSELPRFSWTQFSKKAIDLSVAARDEVVRIKRRQQARRRAVAFLLLAT